MKNGFIKVAAVTPKVRIGDVKYNVEQICLYAAQAVKRGSKIIVFPELSLTGYSCEGRFFQEKLLNEVQQAALELKNQTRKLDALIFVGAPVRINSKIYNAIIAVNKGVILGIIPKTYLPNYDEFRELRYFAPAAKEARKIFFAGENVLFGTKVLFKTEAVEGLVVAVEICADAWTVIPPGAGAVQAGATLIVNGSASNELVSKSSDRERTIAEHSRRLICGYVYSNPGIGDSTDELVFCGHNIIAENGELLESRHCTEDGMVCTEIDIFRLLYERSKNNNFESIDGDDYKIVPFNIEDQNTVLTRRVGRNPFVSDIPEKRIEQCEQLVQILSIAVARKIESGQYNAVRIKGENATNILVTFFLIIRVFRILNKDTKNVFVDAKQFYGFQEYEAIQKLVEYFGGSIEENCSTAEICVVESISFTEFLMKNSKIEYGDNVYAINIRVPQSLLNEVFIWCKKEFLNNALEEYTKYFIRSNEWEIEEFYAYYAICMGFSSQKICRMIKAAFRDEFIEQQMISKTERCCSLIESYYENIRKVAGPKVLYI